MESKQNSGINHNNSFSTPPVEEPKKSYSWFGHPILAHECRTFKRSTLERIYEIITDCSKYSEWWPTKEFSGVVNKCTVGAVGTQIAFTSPAYGDYDSTITTATLNNDTGRGDVTFSYVRGIFGGQTTWSMFRNQNNNSNNSNQNSNSNSTSNSTSYSTPSTSNSNFGKEEEVTVCFNSELIPNTTKLKIYSNFVRKGEANSYFSPLFDALQFQIDRDHMYKRGYRETSSTNTRPNVPHSVTSSMENNNISITTDINSSSSTSSPPSSTSSTSSSSKNRTMEEVALEASGLQTMK